MKKHIQITDAELPIMKVLWEKDDLTSPEIFAGMDGNKSTLKTLLQRLVSKGAIKAIKINSRTYRYSPIITRGEYTNASSRSFIQKVFDGSAEKMLLNFVKEDKINREDLQKLLDMIEEE